MCRLRQEEEQVSFTFLDVIIVGHCSQSYFYYNCALVG
jgi:hypothetical protein